jgi:hypothetical protein
MTTVADREMGGLRIYIPIRAAEKGSCLGFLGRLSTGLRCPQAVANGMDG